ncbi:MAG: LuxR C-terminal-related transcriptional regulator [Aestuariibaculum sp.]
MKKTIYIGLFLLPLFVHAQYNFSGHIDNKQWHGDVYLSVIEDYRKISGIYYEQIVSKATIDSLGNFKFEGNQLENENRIYRIHVDNCFDGAMSNNHFSGRCDDSEEIVFIANNRDTVAFPFSFNKEMFCDIQSTNPKSVAFIKIDSLKEEMKYAYAEFRSEANRKLNNKKWFSTFQSFGENLNEPIAELYIYSFLSDRSNELHEYYLKDLEQNSYYDNLLIRLKAHYPNSSYTKQYENELESDEFILNKTQSHSKWNYFIYVLLTLSLIANFWMFKKYKEKGNSDNQNIKEQLTKQEQNILNLLLEDKTNKEIADCLFISLSTVKTHTNNIYKKLNIQSRQEAKNLFFN